MRVAWNARTRVSAGVVLIAAAVTVAIAVHGLWFRTGTRPMVGIAGAQSEGAFGLPDDVPGAASDGVVDVPAGVFDGVDASRIPGVLPIQEAPIEVQARVQALADERDRIMETDPADRLPRQVIEPPDDPEAPPRVDWGDPDPDRATGASVALPPRNTKDAEQ